MRAATRLMKAVRKVFGITKMVYRFFSQSFYNNKLRPNYSDA